MQWLIDIIKEWIQVYLQGMIVMWSGTLDNIPDGWALCDGDNGTPNLINRFVLGPSIGEAPHVTGGESFHKHTGGNHRHTRSRSQNAGAGATRNEVSTGWTGYAELDTGDTTTRPPYYVLAFIMKL